MSLSRRVASFGTASLRRRTGAAALAVAGVLALSGCGADLHPGTAATAEGTSISQDTVDDLVQAACTYIGIQNEEAAEPVPVGIAELRANIAGALVAFALVGGASDEFNLTIRDSDVESIAAETTLPDSLDADDTALLEAFFYDSAQAQLEQATIGAHLDSPEVTSSAGVSLESVASADQYIRDLLSEADVTVNPAYGTWDGTNIAASSGSLSEAVSPNALERISEPEGGVGSSELEPPAAPDLPPTQECG